MNSYYLAIDIGASSGRHILGHIENGKIVLEEVHRFENFIVNENGTLTWDIEHLANEVISGIAKCKEAEKIPSTVAIDTWGVDYVLLDENKKEILPAVSYRDERTFSAMEEVESIVPAEELYSRTGIQRQHFNTVYQLFCDKKSGKLQKAAYLLMMPEYLSFKLTGIIKNEYTEATTGGLVNAKTKEWDTYLFDKLGFPKSIVHPLSAPGETVGEFSEETQKKVGFNARVVFAPSHDTACAVAACPIDDSCVYISSGTWSLIGTENLSPTLSEEARLANFTNEGGAEYRYRFLENIMGMWLFQNIRRNLDKKYSYDEMMLLAKGSGYNKTFNCGDSSLNAPDNMIDAIKELLKEDLSLPDLLSSVYYSLANSYNSAVRTIERLSNKEIKSILIVGGGSKDAYLNELTSRVTGKKVLTGITEATASGNILSQIMADKKITLAEGREIIKNSFNIEEINI
ncbi:MAG: rhamnulokinase [Oscillospiraceae bacterium]|nr:rhamnulokinase [Oscillospiraceae bacterium]